MRDFYQTFAIPDDINNLSEYSLANYAVYRLRLARAI